MSWVKENAKAVVAFFTSLGTWGTTALAVGPAGEAASIQGAEWFGLCGVAVATCSVWLIENAPSQAQLQKLNDAIYQEAQKSKY